MIQLHHKSSRIEITEYEPSTGALTIFFKRGGTYEYKDVDAFDYDAMVMNPSIGKGFNENIKHKYTGVKV